MGNTCSPLNLGGFRCWVRYPVFSGLCLIAKETEQRVTITLFIIFNNVGYDMNPYPYTSLSPMS